MKQLFICILIKLSFDFYILEIAGYNPVSVSVIVPKLVPAGSSTTFTCRFNLDGRQIYTIKWYRGENEFYRYTPKHYPPKQLFHIPGINVDLHASNANQVILRDIPTKISGLFKCEVSAEGPKFSTGSASANLTVLEILMKKPQLYISSLTYYPGITINISCLAPATKPPPLITFFVNEKAINQEWLHHICPGMALLIPQALDEYLLDFEKKLNKRINLLRIRCEASLKNIYRFTSDSIEISPIYEIKEIDASNGKQKLNSNSFFLSINSFFIILYVISIT